MTRKECYNAASENFKHPMISSCRCRAGKPLAASKSELLLQETRASYCIENVLIMHVLRHYHIETSCSYCTPYCTDSRRQIRSDHTDLLQQRNGYNPLTAITQLHTLTHHTRNLHGCSCFMCSCMFILSHITLELVHFVQDASKVKTHFETT